MPEKPILERAFELARSGSFERVKELEQALRAEGYARADPHLQSPAARSQLRRLCQETRNDRRSHHGSATTNYEPSLN